MALVVGNHWNSKESSDYQCMTCGVEEPLASLFRPCHCTTYIHRSCFNATDTVCSSCNKEYEFEFPFGSFIYSILLDPLISQKWILITEFVLILSFCLLLIWYLDLKETPEIFYLIIVISSLGSFAIDTYCGKDRSPENLFMMNPCHIDQLIYSLTATVNSVRDFCVDQCHRKMKDIHTFC